MIKISDFPAVRICVLGAIAACMCLIGPALPVTAQQPAQLSIGRWVATGPPETQEIVTFSVAPGWPDEGLMLAVRGIPCRISCAQLENRFDLIRSSDAGATWSSLEIPAPNLSFLSSARLDIADDPAGERITFISGGVSGGNLLYRSTDDGTTWQVALDRAAGVPAPSNANLSLSPGFAHDGLVFAVVGTTLLERSTDAGATWTALDPAPGRRPRQLVFSPTFNEDATIFLTLDRDGRGPLLLVSRDAGETWVSPAEESADTNVEHLAPSPAFAQDGTLFASTGNIFERSQDGGASWVLLPGAPRVQGSPARPPSIALSPGFKQDGLGLVMANTETGRGTQACRIARTTDSGATWSDVSLTLRAAAAAAGIHGCITGRLLDAPHTPRGLLYVAGFGWLWSPDGGRSWDQLTPPDGQFVTDVQAAPGFPADPTLLVSTTQPSTDSSASSKLWTVSLDLSQRY